AQPLESTRGGILFHCSPAEAEAIKSSMSEFLATFHWRVGRQVILTEAPDGKLLNYHLSGAQHDTDTLALSGRADLDLAPDTFTYTRHNHKTGSEETLTLPLVSQKEVVAAL